MLIPWKQLPGFVLLWSAGAGWQCNTNSAELPVCWTIQLEDDCSLSQRILFHNQCLYKTWMKTAMENYCCSSWFLWCSTTATRAENPVQKIKGWKFSLMQFPCVEVVAEHESLQRKSKMVNERSWIREKGDNHPHPGLFLFALAGWECTAHWGAWDWCLLEQFPTLVLWVYFITLYNHWWRILSSVWFVLRSHVMIDCTLRICETVAGKMTSVGSASHLEVGGFQSSLSVEQIFHRLIPPVSVSIEVDPPGAALCESYLWVSLLLSRVFVQFTWGFNSHQIWSLLPDVPHIFCSLKKT